MLGLAEAVVVRGAAFLGGGFLAAVFLAAVFLGAGFFGAAFFVAARQPVEQAMQERSVCALLVSHLRHVQAAGGRDAGDRLAGAARLPAGARSTGAGTLRGVSQM